MRMKFKRATTSSIPANTLAPVNKEVTTLATNNVKPPAIDLTKNPPNQAQFLPVASNSGNTNVVTTTSNPPSGSSSNLPVQPPLAVLPASTGITTTTTIADPPKTDSPETLPGTNSPVVVSNPVAGNAPETAPAVQQNNAPAVQQNNVPVVPVVPVNAPLLSESPKGQNVEIKPASQVTVVDPTKTIEYFVSYGLTQTVLDDKTTSVYKTQTYAAIRPIAPTVSTAEFRFPFSLLLLLIFIFK